MITRIIQDCIFLVVSRENKNAKYFCQQMASYIEKKIKTVVSSFVMFIFSGEIKSAVFP